MMKIFLLLLSFVSIAFADVSFDISSTDLSARYLQVLFGFMEGTFLTTDTTIISVIFRVFNTGVLAIGGILLGYILFVSTINTANSGQIMGKSWSTIWLPLRAAIGVALLIPKTSGYCTMQSIIMWVVLQGIGFANSIWGAGLNYYDRVGSLKPDVISSSTSGFGGLFASYKDPMSETSKFYLNCAVCMQLTDRILEHELEKKIATLKEQIQNETYPPGTNPQILQDELDELENTVLPVLSQADPFVVPNEYETKDNKDLTAKFPGAIDVPTNNQSIAEYNEIYGGECGSIVIKDTGNINVNLVKMAAHERLFDSMQSLARDLLDDSLEETNNKLDFQKDISSSGANRFANAVINFFFDLEGAKSIFPINNSNNETVNQARDEGWLTAGKIFYDTAKSYTNVFNQSNSVFDHEISYGAFTKPFSEDYQDNPKAIDQKYQSIYRNKVLYQEDQNAPSDRYIQGYKEALEAASSSGGSSNSPSLTMPDDSSREAIFSALAIYAVTFTAGLGALAAAAGQAAYTAISTISVGLTLTKALVGFGLTVDGHIHPMLSLAIIGAGFMDTGVVIMISITTFLFFGTLAKAGFSAVNPMPWGLMLATTILSSIFTVLITGFVSMGVMLYLYVPLIPAIVYLFGVLGWFFAVIEAMVAAPLVALGLIHPEGHENFGKAQSAIMLLLNIFLRPALMIIGLIFAIVLSYIGIWVMNKIFIYALVSSVTTLASIGPGILFLMPGLFIIYTLTAVSVLQEIFNLITKLPDETLKWIGGSVTNYSGGATQRVGELGGRIAAGAAKAGSVAQSTIGHTDKQIKDGVDQRNEARKAAKQEGGESTPRPTPETDDTPKDGDAGGESTPSPSSGDTPEAEDTTKPRVRSLSTGDINSSSDASDIRPEPSKTRSHTISGESSSGGAGRPDLPPQPSSGGNTGKESISGGGGASNPDLPSSRANSDAPTSRPKVSEFSPEGSKRSFAPERVRRSSPKSGSNPSSSEVSQTFGSTQTEAKTRVKK